MYANDIIEVSEKRGYLIGMFIYDKFVMNLLSCVR